jgi:hypothetical protein
MFASLRGLAFPPCLPSSAQRRECFAHTGVHTNTFRYLCIYHPCMIHLILHTYTGYSQPRKHTHAPLSARALAQALAQASSSVFRCSSSASVAVAGRPTSARALRFSASSSAALLRRNIQYPMVPSSTKNEITTAIRLASSLPGIDAAAWCV